MIGLIGISYTTAPVEIRERLCFDFDEVLSLAEAMRQGEAGTETVVLATAQKTVEHLLKVASGLESMVLGENQILGQVKEAYRVCSSKDFTSTVLNRLFHLAFSALSLFDLPRMERS